MRETRFPDNPSVAERWDCVFRLLANPSRRELVLSLLDAPPGTWVQLPDAARSAYGPPEQRTLSVSLRHQHLPAMADAGYVQWREDPFEVCRGENFDEIGAPLSLICTFPGELPNQLIYGCEVLEDEVVENPNGR